MSDCRGRPNMSSLHTPRNCSGCCHSSQPCKCISQTSCYRREIARPCYSQSTRLGRRRLCMCSAHTLCTCLRSVLCTLPCTGSWSLQYSQRERSSLPDTLSRLQDQRCPCKSLPGTLCTCPRSVQCIPCCTGSWSLQCCQWERLSWPDSRCKGHCPSLIYTFQHHTLYTCPRSVQCILCCKCSSKALRFH
jgi:hypothetical protein